MQERNRWDRLDDTLANYAWVALVLTHVALGALCWLAIVRGG